MHVDSAYSEALKLEALELYNLQLDDQNHCVLTKDKRLLSSYYPGHEIFEWENCYLVITSEPPQITKPVTEYLVISSKSHDSTNGPRGTKHVFTSIVSPIRKG